MLAFLLGLITGTILVFLIRANVGEMLDRTKTKIRTVIKNAVKED